MTWTAGIAIYFVVWWVTFLAVLPWGVSSQAQPDPAVPGADEGAPATPRLLIKAAVTTVVAAVLWSGIAWLIIAQPVSFDDLPFMPDFSSEY